MLSKNISNKKRKISVIKHEGNLDFIVTTFIISLITILGIFMSHYNSDMFIGRNNVIDTVVFSREPTDKVIANVSHKINIFIFN